MATGQSFSGPPPHHHGRKRAVFSLLSSELVSPALLLQDWLRVLPNLGRKLSRRPLCCEATRPMVCSWCYASNSGLRCSLRPDQAQDVPPRTPKRRPPQDTRTTPRIPRRPPLEVVMLQSIYCKSKIRSWGNMLIPSRTSLGGQATFWANPHGPILGQLRPTF